MYSCITVNVRIGVNRLLHDEEHFEQDSPIEKYENAYNIRTWNNTRTVDIIPHTRE